MDPEESSGDDDDFPSDTQWLPEALKQVSGDAGLEDLYRLLLAENGSDEQRQGHALYAEPLSSTASSGVTAATEMQWLITLKTTVHDLLQSSESYIESLRKALQSTRRTGQDLDAMQLCLQRADAAEQEDEAVNVLPLQHEWAHLPLYPRIYEQVPLLSAQSEEVEQLRLRLCTFPWSSDEAARLKEAVINQCLRLSVMQLADVSSHCPDDLLDVVERMAEEQLAAFSLPSDRQPDEEIDWVDVADHVGGTHTAEECRTRWMMVDRPGLNRHEWSAEETSRLEEILKECISQCESGIVCDWEAVAQELDTGRLGIDCFMKSQQEDLVPVYAASGAQAWSKVPLSEKEREVANALHSIWIDDTLVAARLGTGRPAVQIAAETRRTKASKIGKSGKAEKVSKMYKWSERADHALVVYVARECKLKRSHLFAQLDSHGPIDFGKNYLRRPAKVNAKEVEDRWEHIKAEYRAGNTSLARSNKKKGSASSEQ